MIVFARALESVWMRSCRLPFTRLENPLILQNLFGFTGLSVNAASDVPLPPSMLLLVLASGSGGLA